MIHRSLSPIISGIFMQPFLCNTAISDMPTHLRRAWSASLNLFPRSFSPLAVTQSWLRKRFAREAIKKNQTFIITVRWIADELIKVRRHVGLTRLLSVGNRVPSSLWHSGQKLGERQGCAQIWHRAAEVHQVLKAVSKQRKRETFDSVRNTTKTQGY